MTPRGTKDPEYPWDYTSRGKRKDGRNLINEWQSMKTGKVTDACDGNHSEPVFQKYSYSSKSKNMILENGCAKSVALKSRYYKQFSCINCRLIIILSS